MLETRLYYKWSQWWYNSRIFVHIKTVPLNVVYCKPGGREGGRRSRGETIRHCENVTAVTGTVINPAEIVWRKNLSVYGDLQSCRNAL